MTTNYLHSALTEKIIQAFYEVYNTLGYGFLEKVYENALMIELEERDLYAEQQNGVKVYYRRRDIGKYFADITVENKVIVELKSVAAITEEHEAQLVNYLRATDIEVGLLLNFGPKPKVVRRVLTQEYKPYHKRKS